MKTIRESRQAAAQGRALAVTFDMLSPVGQVAPGTARLIVNFVNNARFPGLRRYGWNDPNGFHEHRVLDYKMPLTLNFKDNNKQHYRLENLEMLCYNCYFLQIGDIFSDKPYRDWETDRKSTRLNSSHSAKSRMPSSA